MLLNNNLIFYVGVLISAMIISSVTQAEIVHFKTNSDLINNSKIIVGSEHAGFVGDLMDVPDGIHKIRISAPHNYTLQFTLTVKGKDLKVTETEIRHYFSGCMPELQVTWPNPTIEENKIYKHIANLVLGNPVFGKPTGNEVCSSDSAMGCNKRKIILTVNSEPEGAEIWIDSKKTPFRTDNTLSVPYCDERKTINVLVRLPSMVNCLKIIPLSPDSEVSLTCIFHELKLITTSNKSNQ